LPRAYGSPESVDSSTIPLPRRGGFDASPPPRPRRSFLLTLAAAHQGAARDVAPRRRMIGERRRHVAMLVDLLPPFSGESLRESSFDRTVSVFESVRRRRAVRRRRLNERRRPPMENMRGSVPSPSYPHTILKKARENTAYLRLLAATTFSFPSSRS